MESVWHRCRPDATVRLLGIVPAFRLLFWPAHSARALRWATHAAIVYVAPPVPPHLPRLYMTHAAFANAVQWVLSVGRFLCLQEPEYIQATGDVQPTFGVWGDPFKDSTGNVCIIVRM